MKSKIKTGNISFDLKRFAGIKRDYTKEEVEKLKGTFNIEYTLCKSQSEKLWNLLNTEPYINTLGSLSGNQAVQHLKSQTNLHQPKQKDHDECASIQQKFENHKRRCY